MSQRKEQVRSVGLLLRDSSGNMFVIRELYQKLHFGKEEGDLSFPWETWESGDKVDGDALNRLLLQEVNKKPIRISPPKFFKSFILHFPGHEVEARIYTADFIDGPDDWLVGSAVDEGEIAVAHDGLLVNRGWVSPIILQKGKAGRCRGGVQEILDAYVAKVTHDLSLTAPDPYMMAPA